MILGQWGTLGIFGASTWQGYLGYAIEIEGKVNLGNHSTTLAKNDKIILYQHSDNVLNVNFVDSVYGGEVSASSFTKAEYVIATRCGKIKLKLSLGEGISIDGDNFRIFIDDGAIDSAFKGERIHQLVVWNEVGDKLPPIFKDGIKIGAVIL